MGGAFDIDETSIGIEINGEIFLETTIYSYLLKNLEEKKNNFDKINFLFLNHNRSLEMLQVYHDEKNADPEKKRIFFSHHSRSRFSITQQVFQCWFSKRNSYAMKGKCNHRRSI